MHDSKSSLVIVISWLIIFVLVIFLLRCCNGSHDTGKVIYADSLFYWKNKAGKLEASLKKKEEEFGIWNLNKDSIARVLKVKSSQLKEYVVINTRLSDELKAVKGRPPVVRYDTTYVHDGAGDYKNCPPQIRSLQQTFINTYYVADATISTDPAESKIFLQGIDTVRVAWKRVKEGSIFNRKHFLQIDVSNANPNNVVAGLKAYRVPDPNTVFSINAEGEIIYLDNKLYAIAGGNIDFQNTWGNFGISAGVHSAGSKYGRAYIKKNVFKIKK